MFVPCPPPAMEYVVRLASARDFGGRARWLWWRILPPLPLHHQGQPQFQASSAGFYFPCPYSKEAAGTFRAAERLHAGKRRRRVTLQWCLGENPALGWLSAFLFALPAVLQDGAREGLHLPTLGHGGLLPSVC